MLGRYLLITGTVRFAIEFIRVNERALFGVTVAHLVSLALIVVGGVMAARRPAAVRTVTAAASAVPLPAPPCRTRGHSHPDVGSRTA